LKTKLIIGLLILTLVAVPLFATACEEEEPTPPAQQEEEEEEEGEGNWWDAFGEPQYGGEITIALSSFQTAFDPYNWQNAQNCLWYEALWYPDWTLNPDSGVFQHMWISPEYWTGNLAASWEWTDGQTMVVNLRQDVYWQDKAPVNGRQFTSDDVVWHFDRIMGWGDFAADGPDPFLAPRLASLVGISAQGDFTVTFEFAVPNEFLNANALMCEPIFQFFESRELYDMGEPLMEEGGYNSALNEFDNAVGTGPFMAEEYVTGTSVTLTANPNYWGHDERHPENQLPYVDSIKYLIIPDQASQVAAIRSGQIDVIRELGLQQALSLQDTNPELLYATYAYPGSLLQLRCDTAPFTDIRVRKALQLSLNLPEIAETYYQGTLDPTPVGLINPAYEGFATPYDEWPAELQAEYGYDPDTAMALLDEAAADGAFTPNALGGFDTNVIAASSGAGMDLQLLQIIQQYFLKIGVDMEIQTEADFMVIMNILMNKQHTQMVMMGLSDDVPPQMGMNFYSAADPTNGLCQNDSTWESMVAAVPQAADFEELQRLCREVDMYWLQQHWVVTTFPGQQWVFWWPHLKGYSGQKPDSWAFTNLGMARFWISED
jgi:peptide/nickel transport system substrate-binding protein